MSLQLEQPLALTGPRNEDELSGEEGQQQPPQRKLSRPVHNLMNNNRNKQTNKQTIQDNKKRKQPDPEGQLAFACCLALLAWFILLWTTPTINPKNESNRTNKRGSKNRHDHSRPVHTTLKKNNHNKSKKRKKLDEPEEEGQHQEPSQQRPRPPVHTLMNNKNHTKPKNPKKYPNKKCSKFNDDDILCGPLLNNKKSFYIASKNRKNHPGNRRYQEILEQWRIKFQKEEVGSSNRDAIVTTVIQEVQSNGARFIRISNCCSELHTEKARRRVLNDLKVQPDGGSGRAQQFQVQQNDNVDKTTKGGSCGYNEYDVLIGHSVTRSLLGKNHPGNRRYYEILANWRSRYQNEEVGSSKRNDILNLCLQEIKSNGTRFLKWTKNNNEWIELDTEKIRVKVYRNLREYWPCSKNEEEHDKTQNRFHFNECDILYGAPARQSPLLWNHPGNHRYREIVAKWGLQFQDASNGPFQDNSNKRIILTRVLEDVQSNGARFIRFIKKNVWVELDTEKARLKLYADLTKFGKPKVLRNTAVTTRRAAAKRIRANNDNVPAVGDLENQAITTTNTSNNTISRIQQPIVVVFQKRNEQWSIMDRNDNDDDSDSDDDKHNQEEEEDEYGDETTKGSCADNEYDVLVGPTVTPSVLGKNYPGNCRYREL